MTNTINSDLINNNKRKSYLKSERKDVSFAESIICPICGSPMLVDAKTWRCDGSLNDKHTQHAFDVARQGYVNLLPVQHKKSKQPGDSQESIMARQAFLRDGFYQPLQNAIKTMLDKHVLEHSIWLDVGCGDGYYTQSIADVHHIKQVLAIDISKAAIMALAKLSKQKLSKQQQRLWNRTSIDETSNEEAASKIMPLVATASKLPLKDNSMHGVSSIFSPILPDEFQRVIKKGGYLLIAKPAVGHLSSIRQQLFDDVREHDSDKFLQQLADSGFNLLDTTTISAQMALNTQQLKNLLTMTPYSYRAKKIKRDGLIDQAKSSLFQTQMQTTLYFLRNP